MLWHYYGVAETLISLYLYFIDLELSKLLHLCEMRADGFRLNL